MWNVSQAGLILRLDLKRELGQPLKRNSLFYAQRAWHVNRQTRATKSLP